MVRYWVIAPYHYNPRNIFNQVWGYDLRQGVITIGWHEIGDLTGASKREIFERHQAYYSEKNYQSLQRFWHDIKVGDRIIARSGLQRIVGIGVVVGEPFFDLERGSEVTGGNGLKRPPQFLECYVGNSRSRFLKQRV